MLYELDTSITDSVFSDFFSKEAMKKQKKRTNKQRRSEKRRQQKRGKNKARSRAAAPVAPAPAAPPSTPPPAAPAAPAPSPSKAKAPVAPPAKVNKPATPKIKKSMFTKRRVGAGLGGLALAGGLAAGYKKLKGGQEKTAEFDLKDPQHRAALAAGLGGAVAPGGILIPGAAAAYASEKGRGLPAYGGATLGGMAGAIAGGLAGGRGGMLAGGALGAAGGAYAMHGPSGEMPAYKRASVSEYSALADLLQAGQLGEEAQYAFEGMTDGIESYIQEEVPEKTASAHETDYTIYDESAARIARLETLLKKY